MDLAQVLGREFEVVERAEVSFSCATLDAPTRVEATVGSRSTQASANCASDCPRCLAIPANPSSRAVHLVGHQLVVEGRTLSSPGDVGSGLVQTAVCEQTLGERGKGDCTHAGVVELGDEITVDSAFQHRVRRLVYHQRGAEPLRDRCRLGCLRGRASSTFKVIPARSSSWPVTRVTTPEK